MSERQRVLVLGAGSIGERHVRCFQATGRAEVAICEPNPSIRNAVAERYGIAATYTSLESALAHPFDLAVVATPAPFHISQARELVDRGISPLIEKPLSLNLEGLPELHMVVAQTDVDYRVPILFRPEPYDVWSWITHVGSSSLVIESEIRDGDHVLSRARVVVVFFDLTSQRSAVPPDAYREPLLAAMG